MPIGRCQPTFSCDSRKRNKGISHLLLRFFSWVFDTLLSLHELNGNRAESGDAAAAAGGSAQSSSGGSSGSKGADGAPAKGNKGAGGGGAGLGIGGGGDDGDDDDDEEEEEKGKEAGDEDGLDSWCLSEFGDSQDGLGIEFSEAGVGEEEEQQQEVRTSVGTMRRTRFGRCVYLGGRVEICFASCGWTLAWSPLLDALFFFVSWLVFGRSSNPGF